MNTPTPSRISITVNPTFWELFSASLMLIRYQRWFIILHTIFPLGGLFFLLTPLLGYRLGVVEILLALLCFSFTPLIIGVGIWAAGRQNKLAQGPFTHSFDAAGMHTNGETFSQTLHWSAIPRVRRSKRFIFIFIGPARAFCIPVREVHDPEFFDELRSIAGAQTDFGTNKSP